MVVSHLRQELVPGTDEPENCQQRLAQTNSREHTVMEFHKNLSDRNAVPEDVFDYAVLCALDIKFKQVNSVMVILLEQRPQIDTRRFQRPARLVRKPAAFF